MFHTARTIALAAVTALSLAACAGFDYRAGTGPAPAPVYPSTSFAVFSDPHLFIPELGVGEPALEKLNHGDLKLFEWSPSILDAALAAIREAHPRFVLVPGDLTKDGEEADAIAFARKLESLRESGIAVYVVPGNHDVNNPGAVRFVGDERVRVPNVTPERFAEIYKDFGYAGAIDRDPHSLAYVTEPAPGLWLLAMDACRYDISLTRDREYTAGSFTGVRLAWLKSVLERARRENKAVIAMMHHGVVEHFSGQKKLFRAFVVEDNDAFSRMLAEYGVRVVFTGHFHSQNIAGAWWDAGGGQAAPPSSRFLFDVETGSLISYPSPFRIVRIDERQVMHVRSFRVDSIPEMPAGFQEYSLALMKRGLIPSIERILMSYGIQKAEAERIAAPLSEAAMAHYAGDPVFTGAEMYPTTGLSLTGSFIIALEKDEIEGMWKGKPPHADNNVDIDLTDGTYARPE
jgi:hypothetical protein